MKLRVLAPGKVNLGLFLGRAREDGRHELVTAIESVSLADELTLTSGAEADADGVVCPGVAGRNLVEDALCALRDAGWRGPPVRIEIVKRIPLAGGMAGGSADAAAALRMAVMIGGLRPGTAARVAASLGSDVPSQLAPGLVFATGAGDVIEAREPIASHSLVLVPLGLPLATADVYARADELGLARADDELTAHARDLDWALRRGVRVPPELLANDLEEATSSLCPDVAEALEHARSAGAEHAFVSGSGPTVVGLFWGDHANARADAAAQHLSSHYPHAVCVSPVGADFAMPHDL